MGLAGVSGPFRGAYNTFSFGTPSLGINVANTGAVKSTIWVYTIPAGMDIVVVDAQVYAERIGTNTRLNLLAGGASILKNDANSATLFGVGLTATSGAETTGATIATLSTGVFGPTATSIIAPVTPSTGFASSQQPAFYGAYIQGGATLCASVSNGTSATGQITGTLLWYPVGHPSLVRSAFE